MASPFWFLPLSSVCTGKKHSSPTGSPGLEKRAWRTRHHQKRPPEHPRRNAPTRQWRLSKCAQEQVYQLVRQSAALDGPATSAGRFGAVQTGRACRLRVISVLPDGDRLPSSRPELFPARTLPDLEISFRPGFKTEPNWLPKRFRKAIFEDVFKKGGPQKKQSLCLFASVRSRHFRDARAHQRPQR